nr:helix-turn-helix domain-containing protein [Kibdelosporangium sp. MJ126-NF4]CEL15130.1 Transcriptional regulator, SARP family [Kibdelosporangium sp. MJ126-NF4]CTQ93274.1 putative regulatory protein (AfsR-like protein) [Kibdelosporangium sp. MJ126-NF4]
MGPFGDLLRGHRTARGLTQEALAGLAGLSVQAIGVLERGDRRFPHRDTVIRLAEALELTGDRLDAFLTAATRKATPRVDDQQPLTVPARQLPADVPDFTGRDEHLATVLASLREPGSPTSPRVVVVVGGPGIGKSALAVRAAHEIAREFADGQLHVDLAGTSDQPHDPAVLLAELLHALGVTGGAVPNGVSARATLFRSLLSDRRMLLVLDDAARSEQVRPLLPSSGECGVLVTSRQLLTDLPGARHIELDVLSPAEAHTLFTGIVGTDRVGAEPDEVTPILHACGHLPLAIRIAAGKLVGRPAWPLRLLRERLADESRRLNELRLGELGVRASFEASIGQLPVDGGVAFGLLGLLGPRTVPEWVLGPLLDRRFTDDVLDMLVDANLLRLAEIDASGGPRYRMHDLLRTYAVERVEHPREAIRRLLAVWLDLTTRAVDLLPPSLFAPPVGVARRMALPESTTDRLLAEPENWFAVEREAFVGAVELAATWGFDDYAWQLAATAVPYHDLHSHYEDWQRTHTMALEAVRAAGNVRGETVMLRGLAQVHLYRDEYDTALDGFRRALELARQVGDAREEFLAKSGLATIDRMLRRYDKAEAHIREALEVVTDRSLEAQIRNALGIVLMAQDRFDESSASFEHALEICREIGDAHREAVVLREASILYDRLGEPQRAFAALDRALEMFESLADERCVGYTLLRMGRVHAAHNDLGHATLVLQRAVNFFAANGNRMEEAQGWQLRGELAAQHHMLNARDFLTRALRLWQSIGATSQVTDVQAKLDALPDH